MSDLGQLLKKARLEKGISIEQLEETTKIRKRYLEAIEEGDYKVLPGSFYVRAFIKSYAETVGLDPNEVLGLYKNAIPTPPEPNVEPIRRKRSHSGNTEKLSKWASNILMLSFILLILGVIYYFIGNKYEGSDQNRVDQDERLTDRLPAEPSAQSAGEAAAGTGNPAPAPADPNNQKPPQAQAEMPPVAPAVVTFARTENSVDHYTATGADKLTVQLKITGEECWLRIDKIIPATPEKLQERQVIEEKLYKKGDTREWISDQSVYLTVGFPPAAELIVNGTPIPLGEEKRVKRVQINLQKS